MKNHSKKPWLRAALIAGLGLLLAGRAPAQTFTALYNFSGGNDGNAPVAPLVQSGNTLYGTTSLGGSNGFGGIFSVLTNGTGFSNLYSFTGGNDGGTPDGGLLLSGGVLYGTASTGGLSDDGAIFAINIDGTGFTNLYSFTGGGDGADPEAGLIMSGTTLYGTAADGGSSGDGTVFAVNNDGTGFTTLHSFVGTDGISPQCALVLSGTTLYGTAVFGGASSDGTIFKVSTAGAFTLLNSLNGASAGAFPFGGVILSGTTLYGTAYQGGIGYGTIFKTSTSGSGLAALYSFTGNADGAYPFGGLALQSNTLYGTASSSSAGTGYGTVYSVSNTGVNFSALHGFTDATDGAVPDAAVIISGNSLYGTSSGDGSSEFGTVFKIVQGVGNGLTLNFSLSKSIDISVNKGNETDPAVTVNPNAPTNVFVAGVCSTITNGGLITIFSPNGTTWTTNLVAAIGNTNGLPPALEQPTVAWDSNSNLFLAYVGTNSQGIGVVVSTNGGKSFQPFTNLVPNDVTQYPRLAAGVAGAAVGNVWLVYKDYTLTGTPLVAQGLVTANTGTNGIGPFSSPELIPGSGAGGFPDIAIGPSNQVMVAYQNNINSAATSSVFISVNTNTTTTNGFGNSTTATSDAIGGLTFIPAEEAANGVNAGVGLAWDENPTSLFFGRAYLTYTSAQPGKPAAINVQFRYSVNNGVSWSTEAQVNDDTNSTFSHFLPRIAVDPATGSLALCWYDCRNDTGPSANETFTITSSTETNTYTNIFDVDGKPNTDFMVYQTASLTGGANFAPNIPTITPWTQTALQNSKSPPAGQAFVYSSDAAHANNANGLGHHIGLVYAFGNAYPVWADNTDFPTPANPDFPSASNFDFCVGESVLQTANISIIVDVSPTNPISGESITYSVIVTNNGPFSASNISVTNFLPGNITLVGQPVPAPNGNYSVNGPTIIFNYPGITLAANKSLTNTFVISENQAGFATNIASVGSSLPNPNPSLTIVTNVVAVGGEDLGLGIAASPTNIDIGGVINYTMSLTNLGPASNGIVFITNTLTANLTQVTNVVLSQGTYVLSNNNIIIFSLGALTNQQVVNISYSATAISTKSIIATNTAVVTSTDFDPFPSNNVAIADVTILGEDLGVTLSATPTNVNIGDTITYTLDVTNYGPSASGILTLTNVLSSNLGQITLIQLPPGFGSISKNVISFNMGTLGVGQGITVIYTAVALSVNASATNAISTATISSSDFDTNLVNNIATNIVTINGEDLALGLSGSATNTAIGQILTYTESVTNLGLSTNGIVYVTNTLSPNLSFNSVLQAPGNYSLNGNTLLFQLGAMGVGQTATIVFTAIPNSVGTATETAAVGSSDFDTNLLNNSAVFSTTVTVPPAPISNFTVTALASAAFFVWDTPYPATAQVAYGLTINLGTVSSLTGLATHHVVLVTGLARDTNYSFNAMSLEQGTLYSTNGSFSTVDTVILTTGDASYNGSWLEGSPGTPGYYPPYFNVASSTLFSPTASATYSPLIPSAGYYNVFAWFPQSTNFATNTQMFVAGATNEIVDSVNQTINGATWYPLASNLYFARGAGGTATIYNDTGNTNTLIAANAMKWTYNPAQDYSSNGVPPLWWSTFYFGSNNIAAASAYYAAYVFGSAPNDPADTPDFWVTFPASNTVMVCFAPYLGGRAYQLQTSSSLSASHWTTLTNQASVTTNGTGYGVFTLNQTNAAQSFFRIAASVLAQ